ncbi:unnamed protein product [Pieris macdunnoughi]|uniref:Peptidase S1 domain-containing protein n=1 Tax=Pieris macdunnoughi TaxID=345717 RepID=A0A821PL20_9NEOP|nr:unnamed protein product [Pieris macdunnoughi]
MRAQKMLTLFIFVLAFVTAFADNTPVYHASSQDLDVSLSQGRIVSGWEAYEGQFPYQLSIRMVNQNGRVSACGATLIHNEWALTAGHCPAGRVTLVVRAGVTDIKTPQLMFETTEYYTHPLYVDLLPFVQPNDIALIKFPRPVEYNDVLQPIRLQSSHHKNKNYDNVVFTAFGWGRNWTSGVAPEVMNWVYLKGVSNEYCSTRFGGSSIIVDSTICAAHYNVTSQSVCQGDSGGGMTILDNDGELSQLGIASFVSGSGCHTEVPAGFIRTGHYHDWYTEVTGLNFDWVPAADIK